MTVMIHGQSIICSGWVEGG